MSLYYFVTNLQGDVVRITNAQKETLANYSYDAYGKLLSVTNAAGAAISGTSNIALINPLRYRGYYYDSETELYYLQSRYYDPTTSRFINADSYLSTGQDFLGFNSFAYCLNNPTTYSDATGKDAILLYDQDTLGHIGALIQDGDGKWWHFYWGAAMGISRLICVFNIDVAVLTWCELYFGAIDLESINMASQYSGDYDNMLYLRGDYSSSVTAAKQIGGTYNLYTNNCMQMTMRILAESSSQYADIFLNIAENYFLPASAYSAAERQLGYRSQSRPLVGPHRMINEVQLY